MAIRTPLSSPQAARTLLIVGLIAMSVMIRCEAGVPGDINNDGVLNNLDILAAQAHCIGLSELDYEACKRGDINGSGQLDVGDIIRMSRLIGSTLIAVPDLIGQTLYQAETSLSDIGLTKGETTLIHTDGHANFVRGQAPIRGHLVEPGTPINLIVTTREASGLTLLQVSPDTIDLGTSGTEAIFSLKTSDPTIPWWVSDSSHTTTVPQSGKGDAQLRVVLDRGLLVKTADSILSVPIYPDLGSSSGAAYARIRYQKSTPSNPRLDSVHSREPLCPGDRVELHGDYFANNAADNQVSINGRLHEVLGVGPYEITFQIPPDILPGAVEIRARRIADPILGPSDWGNAITIRLGAAAQLVLNQGADGHSLWFTGRSTVATEHLGIPTLKEWEAFAPDWVLGGRNLMLAGGVFVNPVFDPSRWGTFEEGLAIEIQLHGKSYYLPAMAQSDDVLLVRPHAMLYDKQEFLSQLEPGMTLPARLVASDQKTLQTRFSPWIDLKTCPEAPPIGSTIWWHTSDLIPGLGSTTRSQDAESVISIGSQLILMHSSDDGGPFTMVASGLWNGPVLFSTKTEEAGFRYKLVRLNATGSFTIQNQTNGGSRRIRVVRGGAAYDYNSPTVAQTVVRAVVEDDRDTTLFANGARVHIPAGTLPSAPGYANLVNLFYGQYGVGPSYTLSDPEAMDDNHLLTLYFERFNTDDTKGPIPWEPTSLLEPISISLFYAEEQSRNGPPSIGALDPTSGVYWNLPCTFDPSQRIVHLTIPEGLYQEPAVSTRLRATQSSHSGFPPVSLYRITKSMGIPYLRSERSFMTDVNNFFRIDYISDPNSSSYVSEQYAAGILQTMVQAYLSLKNRAWRTPDGITMIYLRNTISGAYGSTTKAVFGSPSVTINIAQCPYQSKQYYTTAAHEVGHVFQRQYTTNVFAKWFDEAAAEWIALDTVGEQKFLDDLLNEQLPFHQSLPSSFSFGFNMDQGYAAAPWAVWLENHHPQSLRKTYEALSGHPLNWERHHQVIETVTGHSITELYREFARDFWIQSFSPTPLIDLTALTRTEGLKIDLALDGNGYITFSDTRPPLSGMRFSVQPTLPYLLAFGDRSAVIRISTNPDAALAYVHVYGDRAGPQFRPDNPQLIATLHQPMDSSYVLEDVSAFRTYRLILVNANTLSPFTPTIRIVCPTISGLNPSAGSRNGGYVVNVSGRGFGQSGQILLAGDPVSVSSWSDTSVRFIMPAVDSNTASWNLAVQTAEGVSTNSKTFTFQ